jgi:hypothetical protein
MNVTSRLGPKCEACSSPIIRLVMSAQYPSEGVISQCAPDRTRTDTGMALRFGFEIWFVSRLIAPISQVFKTSNSTDY